MKKLHAIRKHDKTRFASYLLYTVSALGLLSILITRTPAGTYTPKANWDLWAYIILIVIAFSINMGLKIAKPVYTVAACAWFITLIFFLPEKFGHSLDLYVVFMQVVITILACSMLFFHPKEHVKAK